MNKADMLGASNAFDQAGTARSARRTLIEQAMGETPSTGPGPLLDLNDIADNPENPRGHINTKAPDFLSLMESIAEIGVTSPISVCRAEAFLKHHPQHQAAVGKKSYVLLAGHRRVTAARLAQRTTVPAQVDDTGAEDPLLWALAENGLRVGLNAIQQAHALRKLTAKPPEGKGLSQGKVAKSIGRTQPHISQLLALLKLIPALQDLIARGELKPADARPLTPLSEDEQRAAYQRFLKGEPLLPKPAKATGQTVAQDGAGTKVPAQTHNSVMGSAPEHATADAPPGPPAEGATHNSVMGSPADGDRSPDPQGPQTHNSVMGQPAPADHSAESQTAATHNSVMGTESPTGPSPASQGASTHNSVMGQPTQEEPASINWEDPEALGQLLLERLAPTEMNRLLVFLYKARQAPDDEA